MPNLPNEMRRDHNPEVRLRAIEARVNALWEWAEQMGWDHRGGLPKAPAKPKRGRPKKEVIDAPSSTENE